jgi:mono/diheme cytochrome c family protein
MQKRSRRRPPPPTRRLVLALLAAACAAGQDDDSGGDDSGLGDGDRDRGAILYREHCAPCHGLSGEGGVGPTLRDWGRGVASLVATIDQTMPTQNPAVCAAACADDVAAYIISELTGETCTSGQPALAPRQLRLLTRREYDATVRDLLRLGPAAAGGPCDVDADCELAAESCVAGACAADPCGRHTFIFSSAEAHSSVHVAGSFNGWPATVAAGGWSMEHVPQDNIYYTKRDLPSGAHTYKFVIDEADWIPDPNNPASEPDGFGGQNSLLQLTCDGDGAGPLFAPARDFPVESRPKGFEYDNNAAAGLVTATHVDKQLAAAAEVAELALTRLGQLLPCDPLPDPAACADAFLGDFGARAFRRPLSADERAKYRDLILGEPDFSAGVGVALRVMLASPYFLYRSELGEDQGDGGARLTPYELASALSYAFWGTMPDDQLFAAAAADQLRTPEQIEAQARRLLNDPRARDLVATFAAQWLGVEPLRSASKSPSLHPEWSQELALALIEETRRFVAHVVFDGDGRYGTLLAADYTFLNGALAAHYGLPAPPGGEFALADNGPDRAGLLGHAAILANYAHSDQSSPVRRGLFVRERLLCQHFGTPPANAGGVPEVDADATTRERFRQHSADQSCALCHQYIDELGFGFERFDAVGRYRQLENGLPIDPAGDMNDVESMGAGTNAPFTTLPQLAQILAASDAAPACFARQAYRFTMGYLEAPHDLCGLAAIESRFAQSGYDVRELLVAIVTAPSFALRQ